MTSAGGSCNACLRIARRRGIALGSRLVLRDGHVGTVGLINHFRDGVMILVHSSDGQETVLLSLEAAMDRDVARGRIAS